MSVKLLSEHHLGILSLTGGFTGSSESTLVKMPHCWKSHVTAQMMNVKTVFPCHATLMDLFVQLLIYCYILLSINMYVRLRNSKWIICKRFQYLEVALCIRKPWRDIFTYYLSLISYYLLLITYYLLLITYHIIYHPYNGGKLHRTFPVIGVALVEVE